MYWRFGFHNASSIDTLLDKPDVTVETILDEDDLLQECKAQNTRLIEYFQRPEVLRTLLGYVSGDIESEPHTRFKYPYLSTEVLCSDIWSIVESCVAHAEQLLGPFWDCVLDKKPEDLVSSPSLAARFTKVNSVFLNKRPVEMLEFITSRPSVIHKMLTHIETPAIVDLLFRLVKSDSQMEGGGAVEWLSSQNFVPRLISLLAPEQRCEVHAAVGDLLKDIISISSPAPGNVNMTGASDEIAQDVSISNMLVRELAAERNVATLVNYMVGEVHDTHPASLHADSDTEALGSDVPSSGELGTDLSDGSSVSLRPHSSISFSGSEDSVAQSPPASIRRFDVLSASTAAPDPETAASSLIHSTGVVIELIRKNHSDYYEPVLFHTLRNRLIGIQQVQAMDSEAPGVEGEVVQGQQALEDALATLSQGVGIVHLGHIVEAVCARLTEFQALLRSPRMSAAPISMPLAAVVPLTFERLRICELYAELFHTSNMALLNRLPGEGPTYDSEGRLQGGLKGLGELARVTATGNPDMPAAERDAETSEMQEARELPVSTSSTEASSISEEDDISEEDALEEVPVEDEGEARSTPAALQSSVPASKPADGKLGTFSSEAAHLTEFAEGVSTPDLRRRSLGTDPFADPDSAAEMDAPASPEQEGGAAHVNLQSIPVGDRLKKRFLDLGVLNTLLNLFFDFPCNNFLHLVVYDLIHQILTGNIEEGFTRALTIHLFRDGRLVHRMLEHQSPEDLAEDGQRLRTGYKGHLMLMADDVITALEHLSVGFRKMVNEYIPQPAWDDYVVRHRMAKDQQNQVLGGSRPVGGPPKPSIFAQIDEVGPVAALKNASGSAGPPVYLRSVSTEGPAPDAPTREDMQGASSLWKVASEPAFENRVNLASLQSLDEEEDDDWGDFSSTSNTDIPTSFADTDAFPTSEVSISERVLTIADLNSSFHADIKANGGTTMFSDEEWPPDQEDAEEFLSQERDTTTTPPAAYHVADVT